MSLLNDASLILTPNAVKEGKLYSIIPSNGNGDMTVVRATTATRVNSLGLIESVVANVPRLNYNSVGGCPSILVEPQRTNRLINSVWAGGGSAPTSWTKQLTGNTVPVTSIKNPNVTAYNFNGVSVRGFLSQVTAFTINNTYAISIYVESVSVANSIGSILITANATGTITYLKNNVTILGASNIEAGNTYTLIFAATATTTNSETRIGLGTSGAVTGNFTLSMPQMEIGSYATSYIPTTATSVTRNADVINKTGISDLIGQTEGTLFCDLRFTNVGTEKYIITVSDTTLNNNISLRRFATGEIRAFFTATTSSGTTSQTSAVVPNGICKLAYIYKSGSLKLFINGVLSFTLTPTFTFGSSLQKIDIGSDIFSGRQLGDSINSIQLYKTALTDSECIALTTL